MAAQVAEKGTPTRVDVPGLDALGHGILVRPNLPHELKRILFARGNYRSVGFKDAGQLYQIPFGYDVDDSPPMPPNQFLNQVTIEESFDRLSKQMGVDANVAVGVGAFSIGGNTGQAKLLRSDEEAFYAVQSSCIPLWSIYLSEYSIVVPELKAYEIPTPFKHEHRAAYDRFFEYFGSHYVKRAWIGGKAQLFLTISKASGLAKEDIHAGLKASFGGLSGGAGTNSQTSRDRLKSQSRCYLSGKGGDELKLAAMTSLDEAKYNEWIASVRGNPQVIETEVAGIWTLIEDKVKAQTLRDAYQEASSFSAISAAFGIDDVVYFVRGKNYFTYHIDKRRSEKPRPVTERWRVLASIEFDRLDAACGGRDLVTATGMRLNRKLFFFRRGLVARVDVDTQELDPGYPMPLAEAFPGLPFERVDAVFEHGPDSIFFFYGGVYVRFSMKENRVADGYPDLISRRWPGVTFERIDAAIHWGNEKVYFFKDDQHIRFDMVVRHSDAGYPKQIVGNYVEDWQSFDS